MASRSARKLIRVSRSRAISDTAKALVTKLQILGVSIATPAVDISNLSNLVDVLEEEGKRMPPIRGFIQDTVALRVENMTFEDWKMSMNSKIRGSWNLHEVLPCNLHFFILLSSINGIFGSRAQVNYAAGNTFKDVLAYHRITQGQKAVSIDLELMVTEGCVVLNESLLASMRRIGHLMEIKPEELITILEYYCDPELPILSNADAQVLVGIDMPSTVLAKVVGIIAFLG
ncbi:KR domain-containing protein [Halenospora varia]|nr:KR domain-containing protein [Halenospora varia]